VAAAGAGEPAALAVEAVVAAADPAAVVAQAVAA
jgi:hypothetical protein